VRIGPFANRAQAVSAINSVEQSLGVRPTISRP